MRGGPLGKSSTRMSSGGLAAETLTAAGAWRAGLPKSPALAGRFMTLHSFTVSSRGELCKRVRALPEGLVAGGPPLPDRRCQRCHPRGSQTAKVHPLCVGAQVWLLQDDVQLTVARQQGQTAPAGC